MADSIFPSNFSGGNVIGNRKIVQSIPCSPRIFQKGLLFRSNSTVGLDVGIRSRPIFRTFRGRSIRADDSCGK